MAMAAGEDRPIIQGIEIGERLIQMVYVERRDSGRRVLMGRSIQFDLTDVEEEFAEFEEAARNLLDAALLVWRQEQAR